MRTIKNTSFLLASISGAFLLPSTSFATDIIANNSATLQESSPELNADASNQVNVRRRNIDGSERNNLGVFKFDTTSVTGALTSANLQFGLYSATINTAEIWVYGLNEDATNGATTESNWDEDLVSYNSMPGVTPVDSNLQNQSIIAADTTFLGVIAIAGGSSIGDTIALSSLDLLNFINSDTNNSVSFILESRLTPSGRDEDIQILSSQRASVGTSSYPTLSLIPEPSTSALLIGVLALGLSVTRRR